MASFLSPSVLQQNLIFVFSLYVPLGSVPDFVFLNPLFSSSHSIDPGVKFVGQELPFL